MFYLDGTYKEIIRMNKLLVIGINYYPELTGIGKYTAEFSNFLAHDGNCEVDVITGNPYYPRWKIFDGYKNKWFTKEKINNVSVYRVPLYVPSSPTSIKRQVQDVLFFFSTILLATYFLVFHKKRYNYVFIAVPSFTLGLAGLFYRFFARKAIVLYHVQDLQIDAAEQLGMIKNKTLLKFYYSIERFILENVNYVSTISEGMQKKILAKSTNIKECHIFSNWINNTSIYPINPKPFVKYDALKGKKIIFYSGSIGEKQGLEVLIATASCFSNRKDVAFVIACEGPQKEKLVELAEKLNLENVYFFNLLPTGQFNELLNASYIHLVIQKEEAGDLVLPSKLTNILGVGGCAIITAWPGTSLFEIVEEAKCGYVVPPFDVTSLSAAINLLLTDEELYLEISRNALAYAGKFLEIKVIIKQYLTWIGLTEVASTQEIANV